MEIIKIIIISVVLVLVLIGIVIIFSAQIQFIFSEFLNFGVQKSSSDFPKETEYFSSVEITEDMDISNIIEIFIENFNLNYFHTFKRELDYDILDFNYFNITSTISTEISYGSISAKVQSAAKKYYIKINKVDYFNDYDLLSEFSDNCDISINNYDKEIYIKTQKGIYTNSAKIYIKILKTYSESNRKITYKPHIFICRE